MKSCYETDRIKRLKPTKDGYYVCTWLTLYDEVGIKNCDCIHRGETKSIGNGTKIRVVLCNYPRK